MRGKIVLMALMAGVMGLAGAPSAEAGVELDDVQISVRWKGGRDEHRPPPPPHGGHEGPWRHHGHRPGGPHRQNYSL